MVCSPDHPNKDRRGYVMEHRLVAETAIGYVLPATVKIHHFNEIKCDNRNTNLVICEDQRYHMLIHLMQHHLALGAIPGVTKHCARCKEIKGRTLFGPDRRSVDDLTQWCRLCINRQARVRVAAGRYREDVLLATNTR